MIEDKKSAPKPRFIMVLRHFLLKFSILKNFTKNGECGIRTHNEPRFYAELKALPVHLAVHTLFPSAL